MSEQSGELIRPDDPSRCKRIISTGQCEFRSLDGSDYCESHGGKLQAMKSARRQYLLDEVQRARLDHYAESPMINTLRDEIASIRIMLETFHKTYPTDAEKLAMYPIFQELAKTCKDLIKVNLEAEIKLGSMISKDTLIALAYAWVKIITEELINFDVEGHEEIVDMITKRIAQSAANAKDQE